MPCHAIDRAKERYGLDLTTHDLKNIARKIKAGCAVLQGREARGSIWLVRWSGDVLRVFLSLDGFVLTMLPKTGRRHREKAHRKTGKQNSYGRVRDRCENWRDEIWG